MADIQKLIRHIHFINEHHKAFGTLIYLGNEAERYIEGKLAAHKLPVNQFRILRGLLMIHPEGMPVYKLREFLIDQKSDVSRLVNKLVLRGLVKRTKNADNKSITNVVLTKKGIELVNEINPRMPELFAPMMCLTLEEVKQLNQVFERILDSFSVAQTEAAAGTETVGSA